MENRYTAFNNDFTSQNRELTEEVYLFDSTQLAKKMSQLIPGSKWDGFNAIALSKKDSEAGILYLLDLKYSGKLTYWQHCWEKAMGDILYHRLEICWATINETLKTPFHRASKLIEASVRFKDLILFILANKDNYVKLEKWNFVLDEVGKQPTLAPNHVYNLSPNGITEDIDLESVGANVLVAEVIFNIYEHIAEKRISRELSKVVSCAYLGMAVCHFELKNLDECDRLIGMSYSTDSWEIERWVASSNFPLHRLPASKRWNHHYLWRWAIYKWLVGYWQRKGDEWEIKRMENMGRQLYWRSLFSL